MADNDGRVAKGILYALTRVILFVVAIFVMALGFYTAMNSMNVNVIAKDAMTKRAQAVLIPTSEDDIALGKLFTQDYLDTDSVINTTKYDEYTISNYYQRTDVKSRIVWPWASKVTVTLTESIEEIVGALSAGTDAETETSEEPPIESAASNSTEAQVVTKDKTPPAWVSGKCEVTLVKDATTSSWKVDKIELVQVIEPEPTPTPSVSAENETVSEQATASAETSATATNSEATNAGTE